MLKRIEAIVPRRAEAFGGKAMALAKLARAGFPVPAGYALPAWVSQEFYRQHLPVESLPAELLHGLQPDAARLGRIRAQLMDATLSTELKRQVAEALGTLRAEGARAFAVRSSALHEDQVGASAAGMHHSDLNLRTDHDVFEAIKVAWASLFQPQTISYLRTMRVEEPAVGVVIQAMVDAEVSGVLFTCNPLTGDTGEVVINATPGLGPALMDGRVSPDTFRVDKASGQLRDQVLGHKQLRVVSRLDGGVREEQSEPDAGFCLDAVQIERLRLLGQRVEAHYSRPRDIEWALRGDQVYLLQARPLTVTHQRPRRRSSNPAPALDRSHLVWTNANVGEALPGVATPLTWSVLSRFSEIGFRSAFSALGCSVSSNAEFVGDFRGRIYLNLSELTATLAQVPGIHPSVLLELGGGRYSQELDALLESRRGYKRFVARLPQTLTRFVRESVGLRGRVENFERWFDQERTRIDAFDPRVLSPAGLARVLDEVEDLLDETGQVLLSVYANLLVALLLLDSVLKIVAVEDAKVLRQQLLSGLSGVSSAEPGFLLAKIAKLAEQDEAVRRLILETPLDELDVHKLPLGKVRVELESFLREHGHRGVREAEIAEPRWQEAPALLFAALRLQLQHPSPDPGAQPAALRRLAEKRLRKAVPILVRTPLDRLLDRVQHWTRVREGMRGRVVYVLGLYRRIALDASVRIEAQDPDAGADAAFFLTVGELREWLLRGSGAVSLFTARRRVEYERNRALPDPPSTFVGLPPDLAAEIPDLQSLQGLAASTGRVEGRARVLCRPDDVEAFQLGEVLIVPAADVGWAPLFLSAGAVVTELGGPLSHASIILREYGVPAVVNVQSATQHLRTGDLVRVDGDSGRVDLLERAT